MKAANEVEPFRYRLHGEQVLIYERIHAGTIILLPDETFTFAYFDYEEDFEVFHSQAEATIERVRAGGPRLDERASRDDLIHHSVVPWVTFTSVSHARKVGQDESVPKIAFGKFQAVGDKVMMPVSVEVHHALMDGLHVGRYLSLFEGYLSDPRAALGM
jgi:chloramphenicol O-acetyltransferase type A